MKKFSISMACALGLLSCFSLTAFAQELLLGGRIVGIEMSTRGVLVAELSRVETAEGQSCPAKDAGIEPGDIILSVNGAPVEKGADIIAAVENSAGEELHLGLERSGRAMQLSLRPALSGEGQWMLGMWLRDGVSGIGTLTFQDPASGIYGALGHAISDKGKAVELKEGSICKAQIVAVEPGAAGDPGELKGCSELDEPLGSIEKNSPSGIFGKSFEALAMEKVETGKLSTGPAYMLSTINGSEARPYSVEINRVYRDQGREQAVITVTDPELLAKTGGIVQGMSGSPLLQNGKLVAAVTHVFVADPSRGYALGISDMLRAAGIEDRAA